MITFNRYSKELRIQMDWNELNVGDFIMIETTDKINPDDYSEVWNNNWLQKYATALIGWQWGKNLIKFQNFTLPSGMTLDGNSILNEYTTMKNELEQELIDTWSAPCSFIIG